MHGAQPAGGQQVCRGTALGLWWAGHAASRRDCVNSDVKLGSLGCGWKGGILELEVGTDWNGKQAGWSRGLGHQA